MDIALRLQAAQTEPGARAVRADLQGQIESFDQYVVLLRNTVTQMVYKHAISTIVPGRAVNFSTADTSDADSNNA